MRSSYAPRLQGWFVPRGFHRERGDLRRVVLILLALLTVAQTAAAQFRVDVWTTEHGLPQNIVRAIHTGAISTSG